MTDVKDSDESLDISDVHCEQSGFLLDRRKRKERPVGSLRMVRTYTKGALQRSLLLNFKFPKCSAGFV